ncbi:hypothetical protein HK101_008274 [Irineochytrium annulatum]|nr:hypothetical protein HK101_008274 [Irineochytrium annulatum]
MANRIWSNWSLRVLTVAASGALVGGGFMIFNILRNDPHVIWVNKAANPHPWLNVDQAQNLKLYTVSKRDQVPEKGFNRMQE